MMKRNMAVILTALMMTGAALGGCGTKGADENVGSVAGTSASANETAADQENTGEKTVLEVWCWDPNFNVISMNRAGEIYQEDHPDVEIKVTEVTSAEIYTKMTAAILGQQQDSLPDIMLMHDKNIKKYVSAFEGTFADLTESEIDFSQFAEYKVAAGTVDGKVYAVPFDNAAAVTALRTDILAEAGYTIDDFTDITWEEFIEKGAEVYEKTGKSILNERADKPQVLSIMLQSVGSWYLDESGAPYIADNPMVKKGFELYREMVDRHVMAIHNDNESYYQAYWSEEVAGGMNGSFILANIMQEESQSGKWDITNVPRLSDVEGASNFSNNGGSSWLVFDGPNKELAADFLGATFGGSVELYNDMLKEAAVIATWLPAGEAENYQMDAEFFSGQPIYSEILEFAGKVPKIDYGIFTAEAQDAACSALSKVIAGEDIDKALEAAQQEAEFAAQQ